jgi:hypothetical protein
MSFVEHVTTLVYAIEAFIRAIWMTPVGKVFILSLLAVTIGAGVWAGATRWIWSRRNVVYVSTRIGVTFLAAVTAFLVAAALGTTQAVFAASTAIVSVQFGLAWSAKKAASVVVPAVLGVISAYLVTLAGLNGFFAVSVAALVALSVGHMFGLTSETAAGVAATAVFAASLGSALTEATMVDRIVATVVGGVIGVAIAAIPLGGHPLKLASARVDDLALDVARAWHSCGRVVTEGIEYATASETLTQSRDVQKRVDEAADMVHAGLAHSRWSLSTRQSLQDASRLARRWTFVRHGADQVNSVARAIFDSVGTVPARSLSENTDVKVALISAGDVFVTFADDATDQSVVSSAAMLVDSTVLAAASSVNSSSDTAALLLGGNVLAGIRQVAFGAQAGAGLATDVPEVDSAFARKKKSVRADTGRTQT